MEINYDICNVLDDKMMDYSAYVILHRALPSIEDGFKVSLRRILYTMHRHNMTKLTKSASVSGKVMEIHPHSDCYPTIVNMVQKDNHVNPFIVGKGAFAYHTSRDTQPASSRYSEIRIAPYSQEMMEGLKKNSVEMIPTFDGNSEEPLYLPTKHPNILTHSQQGMAVGMAANFPSFNLTEVCDCTIDYLNGITDKELVPDFATGGELIYNKSQIDKINNNGLGSIDIKARYEVSGDYILIKEIPYTTTREVIIEKIVELVKSNKLKEIVDVKDTTDLRGMEIEIKTKKNTDKELLMQKLYKLTPLQSSFSANMNCLVNNRPKVLGVKQIIQEWVKFRKQCLKRELQYDIQQLQTVQNELLGLQIILQDLDKAISLIRNSKSEKEVIDRLREFFDLNDKQLEYIVKIRMVNMNQEWLTSKINKLTEVNEQLKVNLDNLESDSYYISTIISQLQDVKKKYGQPRRTTIIQPEETVFIKQNELIEDYNCQIVLTKENYLKKTLRYSDNQKLKDGDTVMQQIVATNKSRLLFFTDKANCYYLNTWDIDSIQPSNLGNFLPSLLQLQDENVLYVVSTVDFKGHILFAFENGRVAKIPLSSYETKTNRSKVINTYNTDSKLVSINYIEKDMDFMAVSSINKVLVVNTSQINAKVSKASQGIQLLKSKNDSVMVEFKPVDIDNVEYYRGSPNQIGKYLIS